MTSRDEEVRAAFLRAIEEDPYCEATRKAFADWLLEHDLVEEARIQADWTKEAQLAAEEFVSDFLVDLTNNQWGDGVETTWEEIARRAHQYLDTGKPIVLPMNNEALGTKDTSFWHHFQILTGRPVPADLLAKDDVPSYLRDAAYEGLFVCACGMPNDFNDRYWREPEEEGED